MEYCVGNKRVTLPCPSHISSHTLWPTSIFSCVNPEHGEIKEDLIAYFQRVSKTFDYEVESGVAIDIKDNLLESKFDLFEKKDKAVSRLYNFCSSAASSIVEEHNGDSWKYLSEEQKKINIHESWFHITHTGGSHGTHTHSNCSWCGIYYVESGDKDVYGTLMGGRNNFHNPRTRGYLDSGNRSEPMMYTEEPEDGKLILFPSYVPHSATPYLGNEDRVVVAFNMRFGTI